MEGAGKEDRAAGHLEDRGEFWGWSHCCFAPFVWMQNILNHMPCMDAKFIDPYAFLDRFAYEVHKFKNLALSTILLLQGLCCVRMLQVIVASVITILTACKRNLFNVLFCA